MNVMMHQLLRVGVNVVVLASVLGGLQAVASAQQPAELEPLKARAEEFKQAFAKANVEAMWDLISADSRRLMENHLAEIKKVLKARPADKLNEVVSELNTTAQAMLDLQDAKAYLKFLLDRVNADERNKALGATLTDAKFSGESAALTWGGTGGDLPQKAVKEEGKWRFVISTE